MIDEETMDRARAGRSLTFSETQALALEIAMLSRIAHAAMDYRDPITSSVSAKDAADELDAALDVWGQTDARKQTRGLS